MSIPASRETRDEADGVGELELLGDWRPLGTGRLVVTPTPPAIQGVPGAPEEAPEPPPFLPW